MHTFLQRVLAASLEPIVRTGCHLKIPIYVQMSNEIVANETALNETAANKTASNETAANGNAPIRQMTDSKNDILDSILDNAINELADPSEQQDLTSTEIPHLPVIERSLVRDNVIMRSLRLFFR